MAESELVLSNSKVIELTQALSLMKEAEQDSAKLHKAEVARAHEVVAVVLVKMSSQASSHR